MTGDNNSNSCGVASQVGPQNGAGKGPRRERRMRGKSGGTARRAEGKSGFSLR